MDVWWWRVDVKVGGRMMNLVVESDSRELKFLVLIEGWTVLYVVERWW